MNEVGDFLAHYGVKGMKWGVRKKGAGSKRPKKPLKKRVKAYVEKNPDTVVRAAIGLGVAAKIAAPIIKQYSGVAFDSVITNKMASNQAKAGAAWMAENRGLDAMKIIDI